MRTEPDTPQVNNVLWQLSQRCLPMYTVQIYIKYHVICLLWQLSFKYLYQQKRLLALMKLGAISNVSVI